MEAFCQVLISTTPQRPAPFRTPVVTSCHRASHRRLPVGKDRSLSGMSYSFQPAPIPALRSSSLPAPARCRTGESGGLSRSDVENEPVPPPGKELARPDAQKVADLLLRDEGLGWGWWRRDFRRLVTADRDGLCNGCFHGVCALLVLQSSPSFLPAAPSSVSHHPPPLAPPISQSGSSLARGLNGGTT